MSSVAGKADILIIDDTPATLHLLSSILEEDGYSVRVALDGGSGLAAAHMIVPDLILLDVKMPDLDGYEVCERLKQEQRSQDIPVIFISALEDIIDKVRAFHVGGVDYVTKPFEVEEVIARVESQLALSRQRQWEQQHAIIEERQRLARELHDAVNQTLFSLGVKAESLRLRYQGEDAEVQTELAEIHQLAQAALAEMRILLFELRPEMLVKTDLRRKVSELAKMLSSRTGAEVILNMEDCSTLLADIHLALYRILQEGMTNIIKHAQASCVHIDLMAQTDQVILQIRDNGVGFSPEEIPDGCFGLMHMRERAAACGSTVEIQSQPGRGTTITITWNGGQACLNNAASGS